MKYIIFVCICLIQCVLHAKVTEITYQDTKKIALEIIGQHAIFNTFDEIVAARTIERFIHELDPLRCYFLEEEITPFFTSDKRYEKQVVCDFYEEKFDVFECIFKIFQNAIYRNRKNKEKILEEYKEVHNKQKSKEQLRYESFCTDEQELINRLKDMHLFKKNLAETVDEKDREKLLLRIEKRERRREDTFLDLKNSQYNIGTFFLKACGHALDCHTDYLTPQEANQLLIGVQQRLTGIGVQFEDDIDGFLVVKILPKGPVDKQKSLVLHDKIIAVNHEPVLGMDALDFTEKVRGAEGTNVLLTVMRDESGEKKCLEVEITRGEVILEETRATLEEIAVEGGIIAYIQLSNFYADDMSSCSKDIKDFLEKVQSTQQVVGVILDVRNNGGGLLAEAVEVSSLFLKRGIVASISVGKNDIQHFRSTAKTAVWQGPLIIMTNILSASASEIVAQTLKDWGRALIIGDTTTYGKGTYQSTSNAFINGKVSAKGEYKVTRGSYFTVSGMSPQCTGVQADVIVPGEFSHIEIGERYSKYPLQSQKITPSFKDTGQDLPLLQRALLKIFYQESCQVQDSNLYDYIDELRNRSYKRQNESVQNKDKENLDRVPLNEDHQKNEAVAIMRDILMLYQDKDVRKAA